MSDDLPLPRARAVLFDLDGTLLDTLGDLADAVNAALVAHGHAVQSEMAICRFIGDGAEMLVRRAMPDGEGDDADKLAGCLATFVEVYGKNFAKRTKPYAGIPELLAGLREGGVPLGILSNKPHGFTLECTRAFFGEVGELFQVVLGQREGVPKKPDPAGAYEAAAALRVASAQCLYVGDSGVDMRTARAAGMVPVGVAWGFRPAQELLEQGALRVIERPEALLEAFAR